MRASNTAWLAAAVCLLVELLWFRISPCAVSPAAWLFATATGSRITLSWRSLYSAGLGKRKWQAVSNAKDRLSPSAVARSSVHVNWYTSTGSSTR